jgi:hypothetical protein
MPCRHFSSAAIDVIFTMLSVVLKVCCGNSMSMLMDLYATAKLLAVSEFQ